MWHDKFLRLRQYHEYLWPISPKTSVGQRIHQRFLLGNCSVLLGNEPWMTKLRAIKWRVCASVLHALRGGKIIKRLYSEEVNFFWKKLLFLLVDELDYLSKCGVGDMQAFVGTDFQGPPLRLLFGNDKPESLQTKRLCLPLSWSVKGQPLLRTWGNVEAWILWPPDVKTWLIWKDPDAGKDWRQGKKGTTEDEIDGWHHWLNGHELGKLRELVVDREAWRAAVHGGHKESDTTEWLNWTVCLRDVRVPQLKSNLPFT